MRIENSDEIVFYGWINNIAFKKSHMLIELIDSIGVIKAQTSDNNIIRLLEKQKETNLATIICTLNLECTSIIKVDKIDYGTPNCNDFNNFTQRHLYNRQQESQKIVIISNWVINYFRNFFTQNNWTEINPPLISTIAEACEDTSSLFWIEQYYGKKAFLVQTSQFYLESFLVPFEKVFSIAHSFRNEKKRSHKHLCEYTHIEAEMSWINLHDLSKIVNRILKKFAITLKNNELIYSYIKSINPNINSTIELLISDYISTSYTDCIEMLQRENHKIKWGDDFDLQHENFLCTHFKKPFFIFDWPKDIKAFYMKEKGDNPNTVEAFDLLLPFGYGELVGASVREDNPDKVWNRLKSDEQMKKLQSEMLSLDVYQWYIDLRKYSSVPHCGFGLGLERLINWLLDLKDIARATSYPRLPNYTDII